MRANAPRYLQAPGEPRLGAAQAQAAPAYPVPPDPAKTQGFIMRGYNFTFTRYFALTVADAGKARAFIQSLVAGPHDWPRVTLALQWAPPKPDHCLNIGFTYRGLAALGISAPVLEYSFGDDSPHNSFKLGAVRQADVVGDTGKSAPPWRLSDSDFDVMLIIWGATQAIIDADTAALRASFGGGFVDPAGDRIFDSQVLEDRRVWFGYKDGIAQPHIAGVPFVQDPDGDQQLADPAYFMLGTALPEQSYAGELVPTPPLGMHGCFGAFRILEQDVEGFEAQARRLAADKTFLDRYGITDANHAVEAVKALICGRWTNGVSLAVFPIQGDKPPPTILETQLNDFLYVLPNGQPTSGVILADVADAGTHCPIASHTRRGNMRGSPWAETTPPNAHRILRRAAAYQSPYAPERPDTGERGLMGFFMGACLQDQFEFVQQSWINNPTGGFSWATDPIDPVMGVLQQGMDDTFQTLGAAKDRFTLKGMTSFVTTRASAYCFFPGIDGIAAIAAKTL